MKKIRLDFKIITINIILILAIIIVINNIIVPRIYNLYIMNEIDYTKDKLLEDVNSDIIYEERNGDVLKTYHIQEFNKVRHINITNSKLDTVETLYEFDERVFRYNNETAKYEEYNFENEAMNDTKFTEALNDSDYVYDFCNDLTYKNYIKHIRKSGVRTKLKFNRYRVEIKEGSMFDGSKSIEFYTDYFGRILNGIYYKEPVGKWIQFKTGKDVNEVKLPSELRSLK